VTKVEEVRRILGWSRPQLAKLADVDPVTIWRIEVEGRKPNAATRARIARALKADELFLWPPVDQAVA
jgi:DNA-binding XRE family transcriptional regulator